jgi:Lrp/AsnC family transcriptional regulator, leucine-responsive regulatory protein
MTKPQDLRYPASMTAEVLLDRIDRRILAVLQAEGRITNQALAERVAMSPSACLARVRRLERAGVIDGYMARLDPLKLGPRLVVFAEIWLEKHHPANFAAFEAAVAEIPEIVEASHVTGDFDYLLKVVVPDMASWTRLAEALVARDIGVDRVSTHVLMTKPKVFRGYPVLP